MGKTFQQENLQQRAMMAGSREIGFPESAGADQFCGKGGGTIGRWIVAIAFTRKHAQGDSNLGFIFLNSFFGALRTSDHT